MELFHTANVESKLKACLGSKGFCGLVSGEKLYTWNLFLKEIWHL